MEQVLGRASIRRTRLVGFPASVFALEDGTTQGKLLARLGRDGWIRVFLGRGQKVELPDGTKWRMTAVGAGPYIEPIVTSETGLVAIGSPYGRRSYHLNGRDFAYDLYRSSASTAGKQSWALREHERDIATFGSSSLNAGYPVPLAAALLCFILIKHGVPGEAPLGVPEFRWA
jgi:hypothetical protein